MDGQRWQVKGSANRLVVVDVFSGCRHDHRAARNRSSRLLRKCSALDSMKVIGRWLKGMTRNLRRGTTRS